MFGTTGGTAPRPTLPRKGRPHLAQKAASKADGIRHCGQSFIPCVGVDTGKFYTGHHSRAPPHKRDRAAV